MVDCLFRLRHNVVIGRNDNNGDVGYLCTACTHCRKGFVTRRIEERNVASALQLYIISTDMLRDAAGLTSDNVGFTDIVEQ